MKKNYEYIAQSFIIGIKSSNLDKIKYYNEE